MKQEIYRYPNGRISYITNYNNSGHKYCLRIDYHYDGSVWYISNWFNNKLFGLDTQKYNYKTHEAFKIQKYYL